MVTIKNILLAVTIIMCDNSDIMSEQSNNMPSIYDIQAQLSLVFTPSAPVDGKDMFAGRTKQVQALLNAILQRGQHAVIYGERGVGKTSLANIISDLVLAVTSKSEFKFQFQAVRFNCAADSSFDSIWHGIFRELSFATSVGKPGFAADSTQGFIPLNQLLPEHVSSEDVRYGLQRFGRRAIIVIDEFDRIAERKATGLLADTIKSLSDHSVDATIIVIGVADSIDGLIAEHKSIERALVQIPMPRMSQAELYEIAEKGLHRVGMGIDDGAKRELAKLSQGLPHYMHSLTRFAAYAALGQGRMNIDPPDVVEAIKSAIENAQQSIVAAYHHATNSPHKNLYAEVLLAAALSNNDDLCSFAAGDLREPLHRITKKHYRIDRYMRHLNALSKDDRGPILRKTGQRRRFRFRFVDPLMEPYVLLKGINDEMIGPGELEPAAA
jgi:Cdc6-like AAA superfamily ATPase